MLPRTVIKTFCWSSFVAVFFWMVAFTQMDDRGHAKPWVIFGAWLSSWVCSTTLLWLVIYSASRAARVPDER